ncbi:MAG TPA: GrpB family protein [Gammaproteobacteria bacterium]|nr:GrpB family protein [Gammaproteobacteria bacterium]
MEFPGGKGGSPRADATTEEYLAAVTVGPREPLNSTIYLAPYDPEWRSEFERVAHRVRAALADKALLLEHVGSTSVPELAAKPIVDMVLGVADSADEPAYAPLLAQHGFVLRIREPAWFEHRLFKHPEVDCHLHVFSVGCDEIGRMLTFRDWLRTHDDERQRYENVKRDLASRTWRHTQNYADAKSAIVGEILGRALAAQP